MLHVAADVLLTVSRQGDDMYMTQVEAFLSEVVAARSGSPSAGRVLSPFHDAVDSYLLSVAIREACTAN